MACSREFAGGSLGVCPHDGNLLVALPQDPYVGKRISDKYHVLSVLGTGGMGVVYLARHETMQCNVAIKMLRAQFVGDKNSLTRFNQEAVAARRLQHPNVITTYDHGFTQQGQPYIVMECLQGTSLADEIKKNKQISADRVIHIFMQVCAALDHAHKQGVIHRDLKPGNIMLINQNDDKDFVKVVDFGVAKIMPINNEDAQTLTQAGEVCGSPVYMSPEQAQGHPLDRRADIYSLGVVIYEALTGKLPLMGKNMVETMAMHIKEAPPPFKEVRPDLYIPERLEQVVMRALSKKMENRQQSMAILRQELDFCVPRPGQNPNLRTINSELPAQSKSKPWLVPVVSAAVTAIVVLSIAFFFMNRKEAQPTATAPSKSSNRSSTSNDDNINREKKSPESSETLTSNPETAKPESGQLSTINPAQEKTAGKNSEINAEKQEVPEAENPVKTESHRTASLIQKTVKKTLSPKQASKAISKRQPEHSRPAQAERSQPASDPFAALSRERTYKINN
ncbi:MAG: protein kinase [Candidatus Obscuribacterales bacterium]|nr:protein kinase [Candidatus Obscuribacterales bacterium]